MKRSENQHVADERKPLMEAYQLSCMGLNMTEDKEIATSSESRRSCSYPKTPCVLTDVSFHSRKIRRIRTYKGVRDCLGTRVSVIRDASCKTLLKNDFDPKAYVEEQVAQINDRTVLEPASAAVAANERAVKDYLGGKETALRHHRFRDESLK